MGPDGGSSLGKSGSTVVTTPAPSDRNHSGLLLVLGSSTSPSFPRTRFPRRTRLQDTTLPHTPVPVHRPPHPSRHRTSVIHPSRPTCPRSGSALGPLEEKDGDDTPSQGPERRSDRDRSTRSENLGAQEGVPGDCGTQEPPHRNWMDQGGHQSVWRVKVELSRTLSLLLSLPRHPE